MTSEIRRLERELTELRAELSELRREHHEQCHTGGRWEGAVELRALPPREARATRCVTPELRAALSDTTALSSMGRALLHRGEDGEYDGYRVSGIRAGSPLERLGLHNGDIVHRVNGTTLDSLGAAMELYTSMQKTSQTTATFELTRQGQPFVLELTLEGCEE